MKHTISLQYATHAPRVCRQINVAPPSRRAPLDVQVEQQAEGHIGLNRDLAIAQGKRPMRYFPPRLTSER